ncbi:MAG TPA: endolytic transglycosylase MltG [Oligoflexia bacterium]|nr:endolytic transglycosylase MltG [Oligoflexia bacterium]HMP49258.1 endolytic transglycosylase MltG [Oligoflexia bacterium]
MKLFSRLFVLFSVVIVFSGIVGASGAMLLYYWGQQPYGESFGETGSSDDKSAKLTFPSPVIYVLHPGRPLKDLSADLADLKCISSPFFFQLWVKAFSDFRKFKAGSYRFSLPIQPQKLVEQFITGETYNEPVLEVTIPEGFTLRQVIRRFVEKGVGSEAEFLRLSTSPSFLKSLGISASSIEGFLYPATYPFYQMPDEAAVFSEMVRVFWKRLPAGYEVMVARHGINLNQAIILASLIEAETPHDDERESVSEVLWGRLDRGMTLGIDASVIYGIDDYDGNLKRKHLEDRSNPYNLRVYQGLPPTPITSPGISSLLAVINPTRDGHLFYVIDPEKGNRHTFTNSLEAHNKEVKKLVAVSKKQ